MNAVIPPAATQTERAAPPIDDRGERWWRTPRWRRFSIVQCLVIAVAAIAPAVVAGVIIGRLVGLVTTEEMIDTALAAGEDPGLITFGAMFLASPVQWITGRSQVRVRKYLGVIFFLLALSNGAMFVIEQGLLDSFGEPFLVAGSIALLAALPLFLTSTRGAQRWLGMRRWRLLHRLTYLVAAALVLHVLLLGELVIGAWLIIAGAVARIPPIRRLLTRRTSVGAGGGQLPVVTSASITSV